MEKFLKFIGMCAITLIIAQSAHAAGIGVYGTGGANFSTWNYNKCNSKLDRLFLRRRPGS